MDLRKTLTTASTALSSQSIKHALIGGFSLAVHGVHRATQDIDFLADGSQREQIMDVLTKNGFSLNAASSEVLHFGGVGHLDILLANRPLSLQMLNEAQMVSGLGIFVLRVEDIIGLKIQAYCNDKTRDLQDKADIQNLIKKNPAINWERVRSYADLFNEWSTVMSLRNLP